MVGVGVSFGFGCGLGTGCVVAAFSVLGVDDLFTSLLGVDEEREQVRPAGVSLISSKLWNLNGTLYKKVAFQYKRHMQKIYDNY